MMSIDTGMHATAPRMLNLINPLNAGKFSKNRLYCLLLYKACKFYLFFMGNDRLSGKQVGSQASRRVTRPLAWIQPVCISINVVPALKGLRGVNHHDIFAHMQLFFQQVRYHIICKVAYQYI